MVMPRRKGSAFSSALRFRLPHLSLILVAILTLMLPQQTHGFAGIDFQKLTRLPLRQKRQSVKQNDIANITLDKSSSSSSLYTTQTETEGSKLQLPPSLTNYYLLWSPKFLGKLVLASLSLWIGVRLLNASNWSSMMENYHLPHHSVIFNGILPTLSSACCWIQLLLNMVTAAGCAGFNTYLGPLRPFFLSVLTYLTFTTRHSTPMSTILLRWTIALLPEMLHLWNSSYVQRNAWKQRIMQSTNNSNSAGEGETTRVSISLDIPSMGCVACINKIDSSLRNAIVSSKENDSNHHRQKAAVNIDEAKSWLLDGEQKGGKANIILSIQKGTGGTSSSDDSKDDDDDMIDPKIISSLVQSIEDAGFPCKVDTIQAYSPEKNQ